MRHTTSTSTSPSPSPVNQVWSLFWGIIHLLCVQPTACSQSHLTNPNTIHACVDTYIHKYMSCPLLPIFSKQLASKKISTDHNATSLWDQRLNLLWWSVEEEFRSLTARGKKLLSDLVVWLQVLWCLLADSSRVNRPVGVVLSFGWYWHADVWHAKISTMFTVSVVC